MACCGVIDITHDDEYIIYWRSHVTGKEGRGKTIYTYLEAQRLCAEHNKEYPDINHYPERMYVMKPSEILREALVLLRDGEGWTRDTLARDQYELPTSVLGDDAYKYCLVGAVMRAAKQENIIELQPVLDYLFDAANLHRANSVGRLTRINDTAMSFDTVTTILHNAATLAERDGQ